jgi:two-component system sensor histidine kinase/response regulator
MTSSRTHSVGQLLSWAIFHQVVDVLQATVGTDAIVLAETQAPKQFVLAASPSFSALIQADAIDADYCQLHLTFSPEQIADFLEEIDYALPFALQENQSDRQSEFTLDLIKIFAHSAHPSIQHQVEQERLINQVTTLIRHSLNLPVILETAVHQVREFLEADRVIIYQFNFPAPSCLLDGEMLATDPTVPNLDGITYESRSSDTIPSILNLMSEYSAASLKHLQKRHSGSVTWAANGAKSRSSTVASLLNQPAAISIQAELVTPIMVQDELWGLLIVHQCQHPRQWQEREKILLQRIAEHLAIAIYQSKLYSELQQQKNTLEQRIIDRTQELRDTLIAAESASLAKSEFLSTMSHELRTPLTTILGMAATLIRAFQDTNYILTPQKQIEYLQIIQERGEHLLALINDLLDLSEVEAGKMILERKEVSLSKLAQQSIQLVQGKADAKQVTLSLELLPPGERSSRDFRFQADPLRVQQICLNLLSNAIKFTPEKGQVTMRVRVSSTTAILQVEDTGIGIPPEQRSLLFQKFKQLDASYHRKYEGTGLGLALTKQLVELHGGTIEVDSKVGVGSKFTVFLPLPRA